MGFVIMERLLRLALQAYLAPRCRRFVPSPNASVEMALTGVPRTESAASHDQIGIGQVGIGKDAFVSEYWFFSAELPRSHQSNYSYNDKYQGASGFDLGAPTLD